MSMIHFFSMQSHPGESRREFGQSVRTERLQSELAIILDEADFLAHPDTLFPDSRKFKVHRRLIGAQLQLKEMPADMDPKERMEMLREHYASAKQEGEKAATVRYLEAMHEADPNDVKISLELAWFYLDFQSFKRANGLAALMLENPDRLEQVQLNDARWISAKSGGEELANHPRLDAEMHKKAGIAAVQQVENSGDEMEEGTLAILENAERYLNAAALQLEGATQTMDKNELMEVLFYRAKALALKAMIAPDIEGHFEAARENIEELIRQSEEAKNLWIRSEAFLLLSDLLRFGMRSEFHPDQFALALSANRMAMKSQNFGPIYLPSHSVAQKALLNICQILRQLGEEEAGKRLASRLVYYTTHARRTAPKLKNFDEAVREIAAAFGVSAEKMTSGDEAAPALPAAYQAKVKGRVLPVVGE